MNRLNFELAFEQKIDSLMDNDSKIVLVLADMGRCIFSDEFLDKHKKSIYNFGISEQNMISVAAGMSTKGLKPFVITFASFLTQRAFDQISNSIAYPKFNVKLIGLRPGLADKGGASHTSLFDISLMRSLPNMNVLNPCSTAQVENMLDLLVDTEEPAYMRLSSEFTNMCLKAEHEIQLGGSKTLKEGKDGVIIATGLMVSRAMYVSSMLKKEDIHLGVVDAYSLKPFDTDMLKQKYESVDKIITLEEHSTIGGLKSIVSEELVKESKARLFAIGIEDDFGTSGYQKELFEYFGLENDSLKDKIKEFVMCK